MAVIVYKKTHFTEPDKISESTYIYYKKMLSEDTAAELVDNAPTFTGHFRRTLRNLPWMLAVCLLLSLIYFYFFNPSFREPDNISRTLFIITLLIGFVAFGLLLRVLLEGPSYATYIKDRNRYFGYMKAAILDSQDYYFFLNSFYSGGKERFKTTDPPLVKQPFSADRFLTDVFYLIDKYWWILFLIGAALFFGRKLFF